MAKLYLGTREVTPAIYNQYKKIIVINNTEATINKDDKVWINRVGNVYNAVTFVTTSEDFTAEGSLTIDSNGIASNFSNTNYISVNKYLNRTTEIITKVNLTTVSDYSIFVHSMQNQYSSLYIEPNTGCYSLFDGVNSVYVPGTTPLQTNKWYWIRYDAVEGTCYGRLLEDNGYTIDTLPDISNWSLEWTTSYNIFNGYIFKMGAAPEVSQFLQGSMDLKNTKININGVDWTPFETSVNVNENSLTGIATENIASGSTGNIYILDYSITVPNEIPM